MSEGSNIAEENHAELFGEQHVDFQFTPTVDFHSEEFASDYLVGYRYTVREDCVLLKSLVYNWINAGMVQVVTDKTPSASINGEGE